MSTYEEDMEYVHAKLEEKPGSFLQNFLTACLHADPQNYRALQPALRDIRERFPLRAKPLNDT